MVKMALHVDTMAGGGRYAVGDIARFLEEEGIDGAVISDHDNARITYGLFPFRSIVKRTLSLPSIEEYGAGTWFSDIREAQRRHPHLILIPGAEAVPFYYWEGNPLLGNLTLRGWQRHLLVVGLGDSSDIGSLPALHRRFGNTLHVRFSFLFLGAGMVAAGIYMTWKKQESRFRFDRLSYIVVSRRLRIPGIISLAASVLFLAEALPFRSSGIDQYHGDRGALPYQRLIDKADSLGALTFWAHPEAAAKGEHGGVAYESDPYHHLLLQTRNYDGFAIFWSGDAKAGGIGGAWDEALGEYARGEREKPVWAVGELDWEGEQGTGLLGETLTLCFPNERSAPGVLSAMRSGRMVAVRKGLGKEITRVDFFLASDAGDTARLGEELLTSHPPTVVFTMERSGTSGVPEAVALVRNGRLLTLLRPDGEGRWTYRETEVPGRGEIWYYRVVVGEEFAVLATNPVFVRKGNGSGNVLPAGRGGSS
jgi:hypothetical protein